MKERLLQFPKATIRAIRLTRPFFSLCPNSNFLFSKLVVCLAVGSCRAQSRWADYIAALELSWNWSAIASGRDQGLNFTLIVLFWSLHDPIISYWHLLANPTVSRFRKVMVRRPTNGAMSTLEANGMWDPLLQHLLTQALPWSAALPLTWSLELSRSKQQRRLVFLSWSKFCSVSQRLSFALHFRFHFAPASPPVPVTSHVRPEEVSKLGGASPHWYIQERALIGGFIEWCWLVPDISNLQQTSHWKTEIKMEHLTEDPYRSFWVLACLLFLSQLQQHGLQRKMVLRCQEKQRQLEKAVASKTAVKFHICAFISAFWSLYSTLFLRRDLSCVLRCKLRACWFAWNNFCQFLPWARPCGLSVSQLYLLQILL